MADMRSRMAALRARRVARVAEEAQAKKPQGVDPELLAAAAAAGAPRTTWDADYRERLAGILDSSDSEGEEDAIVVLPPPAVKLDPVASRVAWRKAQRAAASAAAAEMVRERFPAPMSFSQPKVDAGPVEEVENEEQLLMEEEIDEEEAAAEGVADDEEEGGEGTEGVRDEEEAGAVDEDEGEQVPDGQGAADDGDVAAPSEQGDDVADEDGKVVDDGRADGAPADKDVAADPVDDSVPDDAETQDPNAGASLPSEKATCEADDEANEVTYEEGGAAMEQTRESAPDMEGVRSVDADEKSALVAEAADSPNVQEITAVDEKEGNEFDLPEKKVPSFFARKKSGVICAETQPGYSGLIDDEASDVDGAEENDAAADSDLGEDDVLLNDGVEADGEQTEEDAARLAAFHRQWEKDADDEAVRNAAKATSRKQNVDDQMDLVELVQKRKERDEQLANQSAGEDDDAVSLCMGPQGEQVDGADNYVEAMFLDHHSDVEAEDDVGATPEEKKAQARALWAARRRHMEEREAADPNVIGLLTFDGESCVEMDEEAAEQVRARFRPKELAPEKRKKRSRVDEQTRTWLKKKEARATIERRRGNKVSIHRFQYDNLPADLKTPPKQKPKAGPRMRVKKVKEVVAPVGTRPCKTLRRPRPLLLPTPTKRVQADPAPPKHRPASMRKLFALLGEKPKSNV